MLPLRALSPTWSIRTLSYPHPTVIFMLINRIQKTFQPHFLKWELGLGAEACVNQGTYPLLDQQILKKLIIAGRPLTLPP